MAAVPTREFEVAGRDGVTLRGWVAGEGAPILLAHGITAHRDLVLHGSSHLSRHGFEVASYDARAHGRSDPAEPGAYGYERLVDDLEAVAAAVFSDGDQPLLVGHSMGAHTILAAALRNPDAYSGLVVIGPVSRGAAPSDEALEDWDAMADGLAEGGVEGWLRAYEANGLDPEWRDRLLRIARARIAVHEQPGALAQALREVPRSVPYDGLEPLAGLELPVLVVASHDEADPGHPYETAEQIAETLPRARLISEEEGESPLAWQGGLLSREIEKFAREDAGIG
jgi:pimeloyl-ACP methyl ester carboxylesterase